MKPFGPWVAGAAQPEILITVPLKDGEDFTGYTLTMYLTRTADVLTKACTEVANVANKHVRWRVDWSEGDLQAGNGQQALFVLNDGTEDRLLTNIEIDVLPDPSA
jgi:hypothetical protein